MIRADFAALLAAMNSEPAPRRSGQVSPAVCRAWEASPEAARAVDAVIVWEIGTRADPHNPRSGRLAGPGDMGAVAEMRRKMDEATATALSRGSAV